jgi:hypothetical protein
MEGVGFVLYDRCHIVWLLDVQEKEMNTTAVKVLIRPFLAFVS